MVRVFQPNQDSAPPLRSSSSIACTGIAGEWGQAGFGRLTLEQIERAKRYLWKIEKLYEGIFSSSDHDSDAYDDDVISFFIHCYHIRDWIVHLNKLGITAQQVDAYINRHKSLMVCSDLANGSKHCKLTRSLRTGRQPHIVGKVRHTSTWFAGDTGGEVLKCKYTILSNTELFDALELARECVGLWESFVKEIDSQHRREQGQEKKGCLGHRDDLP